MHSIFILLGIEYRKIVGDRYYVCYETKRMDRGHMWQYVFW